MCKAVTPGSCRSPKCLQQSKSACMHIMSFSLPRSTHLLLYRFAALLFHGQVVPIRLAVFSLDCVVWLCTVFQLVCNHDHNYWVRMCKNRTVISTKEGQMHSQPETKSEMFQKIKLKRLGQCRGLQQCGNWCLKRYIQVCEPYIAKMQHDHFQIMGKFWKHWCSDQWRSQVTNDAQASKFLHLRGSNSDCSWHYFWNAVGLE